MLGKKFYPVVVFLVVVGMALSACGGSANTGSTPNVPTQSSPSTASAPQVSITWTKNVANGISLQPVGQPPAQGEQIGSSSNGWAMWVNTGNEGWDKAKIEAYVKKTNPPAPQQAAPVPEPKPEPLQNVWVIGLPADITWDDVGGALNAAAILLIPSGYTPAGCNQYGNQFTDHFADHGDNGAARAAEFGGWASMMKFWDAIASGNFTVAQLGTRAGEQFVIQVTAAGRNVIMYLGKTVNPSAVPIITSARESIADAARRLMSNLSGKMQKPFSQKFLADLKYVGGCIKNKLQEFAAVHNIVINPMVQPQPLPAEVGIYYADAVLVTATGTVTVKVMLEHGQKPNMLEQMLPLAAIGIVVVVALTPAAAAAAGIVTTTAADGLIYVLTTAGSTLAAAGTVVQLAR